jgi:homocysteine S-methyltransferase
VYPNSGEQWDGQSHRWQGSWENDSLAALAPAWISAGARLVGGCCRIGPRDIAALHQQVNKPVK